MILNVALQPEAGVTQDAPVGKPMGVPLGKVPVGRAPNMAMGVGAGVCEAASDCVGDCDWVAGVGALLGVLVAAVEDRGETVRDGDEVFVTAVAVAVADGEELEGTA